LTSIKRNRREPSKSWFFALSSKSCYIFFISSLKCSSWFSVS